MKNKRTIKSLPEYLQPKILSAIAYVNEAAPNMKKSVERIKGMKNKSISREQKIAARLKYNQQQSQQ